MSGIALLLESADLARGGAERASLAMARGLAALGERVALVAPADRSEPGALPPGVALLRVELVARGRAARARELAWRVPEAAAAAGYDIRIACGKLAPAELIWPHGGCHAVAWRAAARAGRSPLRAAMAIAARRLRPVERAFARIEAAQLAAAGRGEAWLVGISEMVRADLIQASGLPASAVDVIRNGAPVDAVAPLSAEAREAGRRALRAELGLPDEARLILFVAMNPRLKGADALRAAHATLPEAAHILWVGARPPGELRPRERALGLREDVLELLQLADALAHPTRYDPCSLVTLEALAAGCPVVTTSRNGAAELAGEGAILAATPAELAAGLRRLLEDEAERDERAAAARRAAEAWSPGAAAEAMRALAQRFRQRRRGPGARAR